MITPTFFIKKKKGKMQNVNYSAQKKSHNRCGSIIIILFVSCQWTTLCLYAHYVDIY